MFEPNQSLQQHNDIPSLSRCHRAGSQQVWATAELLKDTLKTYTHGHAIAGDRHTSHTATQHPVSGQSYKETVDDSRHHCYKNILSHNSRSPQYLSQH